VICQKRPVQHYPPEPDIDEIVFIFIVQQTGGRKMIAGTSSSRGSFCVIRVISGGASAQ
jgi:hypothetical protein